MFCMPSFTKDYYFLVYIGTDFSDSYYTMSERNREVQKGYSCTSLETPGLETTMVESIQQYHAGLFADWLLATPKYYTSQTAASGKYTFYKYRDRGRQLQKGDN